MKTMLKAFYTKPLVIYLVVALLAISTFAGPADAMFVPASPHQDMTESTAVSAGWAADMAKIQMAFELKSSSKNLWTTFPPRRHGAANKLSDEQIHQLATHTDSLQSGRRTGVDILISLLVVAILVVVLVYCFTTALRSSNGIVRKGPRTH